MKLHSEKLEYVLIGDSRSSVHVSVVVQAEHDVAILYPGRFEDCIFHVLSGDWGVLNMSVTFCYSSK